MSSRPPSFAPTPDPERRRPGAGDAHVVGSTGRTPDQVIPPVDAERVDLPPSYPPATTGAPRVDPPAPPPPSYPPTRASSTPPPQVPRRASTPVQAPAPRRVPPTVEAPPPARPGTARPRRRHRGRRLTRLLVVLLVVCLAWPTFLVWDANRHLQKVDALSSAADTSGTTYLLAGSDSRADGAVADDTEGQRADSVMLVHVASNGQASATSLPRDAYVEIPGYGWGKLNASYSYGGAPLLVETVEKLTGLRVDHFVEIGMGGVGSIVDAVGGVELCLDYDVNDEKSGLVWTSGCHVSDGTTALAFSRMRYSDPLGDIGRAQRQRQVVENTISTALAPRVLLNPVSAFRLERAGAAALTVDQDSSVLDIARLVLAFRSAGKAGLTGAPPIADMGYATSAGSTVLLQDTTAPDFFAALAAGTLTTDSFAQLQ